MELLWEKFINVMSHLLEEHQALLALSKEKRQVLINADVEGLANITKKEEVLVLKINKLEEQRQAVIKEIAAAAEQRDRLEAGEMVKSLAELKKLADEKYAGRLEQLGAQLKDCIKQLRALSELNAKLIAQHLEFIEFNINILSAAACEQTYSATPGESQVKRRSLLNTQA